MALSQSLLFWLTRHSVMLSLLSITCSECPCRCSSCCCFFFFFKILFIYFQRKEGRKGERHQCVVASQVPGIQALAQTGNQTGDSLVRRPVFYSLSRTSRGLFGFLIPRHTVPIN